MQNNSMMTKKNHSKPLSEKRLLQITIVFAAIIPIAAGGAGVFSGLSFFGSTENLNADSHFRYLSGLLLAIGLAFWAMVPHIEKMTQRFRLLTFVVATGGFARLLTAIWIGVPDMAMILAIVMELVITPLLCIWQASVSQKLN